MQLSGVRLSVRPSHHSHAAAAGLLLSAVPAADIDQQRRRPGAWRSAANAGGQCHVVSRRRKQLNTLNKLRT